MYKIMTRIFPYIPENLFVVIKGGSLPLSSDIETCTPPLYKIEDPFTDQNEANRACHRKGYY